MAEAMNLTPNMLEIMEASSALSNVASLDNQLVEEEYDAYYSEASPENNLDSIMIKKEIANLKARERQVIILRYYKDMTQQEIAKLMGISQVQVSRIEKKALENIRQKKWLNSESIVTQSLNSTFSCKKCKNDLQKGFKSGLLYMYAVIFCNKQNSMV